MCLLELAGRLAELNKVDNKMWNFFVRHGLLEECGNILEGLLRPGSDPSYDLQPDADAFNLQVTSASVLSDATYLPLCVSRVQELAR